MIWIFQNNVHIDIYRWGATAPHLYIMQYLKKYTDILDANNVEYEVVYWNRENSVEKKDFDGNTVVFEYSMG